MRAAVANNLIADRSSWATMTARAPSTPDMNTWCSAKPAVRVDFPVHVAVPATIGVRGRPGGCRQAAAAMGGIGDRAPLPFGVMRYRPANARTVETCRVFHANSSRDWFSLHRLTGPSVPHSEIAVTAGQRCVIVFSCSTGGPGGHRRGCLLGLRRPCGLLALQDRWHIDITSCRASPTGVAFVPHACSDGHAREVLVEPCGAEHFAGDGLLRDSRRHARLHGQLTRTGGDVSHLLHDAQSGGSPRPWW